MTTSKGGPTPDLAGYSLVLLNNVGQLAIEAEPSGCDGDPIVVRLIASCAGAAMTQVTAMLPDGPEMRAFAERAASVGTSPAAERSETSPARAAMHLHADRLRARVEPSSGIGAERIALQIRAVEDGKANDVVISLAGTAHNRDLVDRIVRAIEGHPEANPAG